MKTKMNKFTKKLLFFLVFGIVSNSMISADYIDCINNVMAVYSAGVPAYNNFMTSMMSYNEKFFLTMKINAKIFINTDALGYFKFLLTQVENIDYFERLPHKYEVNYKRINSSMPEKYVSSIKSPAEFCQRHNKKGNLIYPDVQLCLNALYIMFKYDANNLFREYDEFLVMSGFAAFQDAYLKYTYVNFKSQVVFPEAENIPPALYQSTKEDQLYIMTHYLEYLITSTNEIGMYSEKKVSVFLINTIVSADINDCKKNVYKVFDENIPPHNNFMIAMSTFNEKTVETENENALQYFQLLVRPIENYDSNKITSPASFCQIYNDNYKYQSDKQILCLTAIHIMLRHKDTELGEDYHRVLGMSGYEAFKHIYLKYTYLEFEDEIVFKEPETSDNIQVELIQPNQIRIMYEYFELLIETANKIAMDIQKKDPELFPTVDEYCQAVEQN